MSPERLAPPQRVLVIQLRRLGDVALTTALLEDLHRAFPDAALSFLTGASSAQLLALHPRISELFVLQEDSVLQLVELALTVRARHFDWVVDVQGSTSSALITRLSGARVRIGWSVPVRGAAYTHRLSRERPHEYVARERQRLLELAGVHVGEPRPRLVLSHRERDAGEAELRRVGAPPDRPRVLMLLSTREGAKDWRIEHFATVARAIAAEGVTPVVLQGPDDASRVARIRGAVPAVASLPPLDLRRLMAVIARCDVFLSGDTGPAHIADALGAPRVTVFGPTDPVSWVPARETAIALRGAGRIVARMKDRRHTTGESTDAVAPEMVLDVVRQLLARRRPRATESDGELQAAEALLPAAVPPEPATQMMPAASTPHATPAPREATGPADGPVALADVAEHAAPAARDDVVPAAQPPAPPRASGPPPAVLFIDLNTEWRGGQRQILWMAEGLRARGGRPILALRPQSPLALRARAVGLEVVPVDPTITEFGPWTVLRLRRILRRERVRILHPQCGHSMALAALAAAGTGAKVVFARRVAWALRPGAMTRLKYRRADRIISVSRAGVPPLLEAGIDPARVEVVPSGVPLDRVVHPTPRDALGRFGVPAGAPLVAMVAALAEVKDPVTFARAVAVARRAVPTLHALLVGDGVMRAAVEHARDELGIADALHLTGFRSDAEEILAAADIVALTSRFEGTPGVLIDALAFGKPIVATDAGGTAEVVEHGVSGLIVPVGDADAFGAALASLASDPALAARLAAGARARAAQFSIDRTVDDTIAIYHRLLAGDGA